MGACGLLGIIEASRKIDLILRIQLNYFLSRTAPEFHDQASFTVVGIMSHDAPSKKKSPLRQLVDIISASVDQIDATFEKSGEDYPGLDTPFDPTSPSEAIALSPEVLDCSSLIVAACAQLSATVHIPAMTIHEVAGGFHVSSALRMALEGNTAEILGESPGGLHVRDIATKNGKDPVRLATALRLLTTHHIFIETSPDVFKNNRPSSMMDTLKIADELKAKLEGPRGGAPWMSASTEHICDETCEELFKTSEELFKSSNELFEASNESLGSDELFKASYEAFKASNESFKASNESFKASFKASEELFKASLPTKGSTYPVMGSPGAIERIPVPLPFQYTEPSWEPYQESENEYWLKGFMAAMEGSAKFDPPNAILQGFNWGDLPAQSLIVDVRGGIGHTVKKIREAHPNLKYVVQDRPTVVEQARTFWQENLPSALSDGSVSLEAHDFLRPQSILHPSVFICRMIIHNHGRSSAKFILRNLRDAALEDTKLLVIDQIVPDIAYESDIPGMNMPRPPAPLLSNIGKTNAIEMFAALAGEKRTIGMFIDLLSESGWKITRVFPIPGSIHKQILAVPV